MVILAIQDMVLVQDSSRRAIFGCLTLAVGDIWGYPEINC